MADLFRNNGHNYSMREPIQVDAEGLYFGASNKEYKHRYMKAEDWSCKPRFSTWNKRNGRNFIKYFKDRGIEITIFTTTSRNIKEEWEE